MAIGKTTLNRHQFFQQLFAAKPEVATESLEEYTEPLSLDEVYHLLRKCCFTVNPEYAKSLVGKRASEAVDELIINASTLKKEPYPFDFNQTFRDPDLLPADQYADERYFNLSTYFAQNEKLIEWWIGQMRKDTQSLSEKVTFFWHSHFCTQYEGNEPIPAQWMGRQMELFRRLFLSNFETFLYEITLDGSMLLYLNGNENIKDAPNENYARELLELFSVGIGDGHYTEEDIRESAKILTGWRASRFKVENKAYNVSFIPHYFSTETKTVFGEEITVDYEVNEANVRENSIRRYIKLILDKRGIEAATFISGKLYKYFVYNKPDNLENPVVQSLAAYFKDSGFDVKKTLKKLLTSQHFFDPAVRGIRIKSPLENLTAFAGHFNVDNESLRKACKSFSQEPLNPPNVSGWKGYRTWITTRSLPGFIDIFAKESSSKTDDEIGQWAAKLDGFESSEALVESVCLIFCGRLPDEERMKKLENHLLGGAPYYEWPNIAQNKAQAGVRVKLLLKEIFKMPEFYLA
ncbi:DUF1800 domain-containing protein [Marinilongibacter aquaticus]|uniref:DUF1800 domain-containing protein n=1 Tax=Marinilongibacter aquaticus TaxID=2975157 RepID=UPI0021BD5812|nr:DUF1800 domain-containing protein [Marinilongibacter aquaticus]UBM57489.1 DUF1800 domain-containing protein [Marinilongibacter aquaticus]